MLVLALAAPALAAAAPKTTTTGRLLVSIRMPARGRARTAALTAIAAGAGRIHAVIPQIGAIALTPAPGLSPHALAERLRAEPGVRSVQAERRASLRYVPNDPALTTQEPATGAPPGTPVEWWAAREFFPQAWDIERGNGAKVGIIDVGIESSHPEFAGRIDSAVAHDSDPADDGPGTTDAAGHGTHVASLACAAADNGIGLAGAGFGCHLLIYKSDLTDASEAQSIVEATDKGALAINMSFGTDGSTPAAQVVVDAIDYAYRRNVVLVAAAADSPITEQGDPSNVLQPSGTGPILTEGKGLDVTASNFANQRASFAGFGSQISLAAAGSFQTANGPRGIFGAFPAAPVSLEQPSVSPPEAGCECRTVFNGDSRYAYVQGTSMAAPQVTATAALVRALNPALHAADVIQLIKATASRPPGVGWTSEVGWGILNAGAALAGARTLDRTAPVSHLKTPAHPRSSRVRVTLTAHDVAPKGCVASGVAKVELWLQPPGRKARRIETTTKRTATVRLARGRQYRLWSIAVDKRGNREPAPRQADARVLVA